MSSKTRSSASGYWEVELAHRYSEYLLACALNITPRDEFVNTPPPHFHREAILPAAVGFCPSASISG